MGRTYLTQQLICFYIILGRPLHLFPAHAKVSSSDTDWLASCQYVTNQSDITTFTLDNSFPFDSKPTPDHGRGVPFIELSPGDKWQGLVILAHNI